MIDHLVDCDERRFKDIFDLYLIKERMQLPWKSDQTHPVNICRRFHKTAAILRSFLQKEMQMCFIASFCTVELNYGEKLKRVK